MKPMIKEDDVIKFLLERGGEATLEEISSALKIPKYGPNSAYAILYSLKSKNVVERRGSRWALVEHESPIRKETETAIMETKLNVEEVVEEPKKNLEERTEAPESLVEANVAEIKVEGGAKETYFLKPDKSYESLKSLESLQTGTFLDTVFLGFDGEPLGGIPVSGQFAVAGPLGSGKSLLVGEVALRTAYSGLKVLYVALDDVWKLETRIFDLQSRMRLRAEDLGLSWDYISENLYVLNPNRIDGNFAGNYKRIVNDEKIDLAILDSVNGFERLGKQKAGGMLDEIIEVNRSYGVTGLFVMHTNFRCGELSGWIVESNYPLYAMDGVILMVPVRLKVSGLDVEIKGGGQLRVVRVLSCKICCFDERGILVNIAHNGLMQPIGIETSDY